MGIGVWELGIYGFGFALFRGMACSGRFWESVAWRMCSTAEYHLIRASLWVWELG
jgi:hypothetical protein